VKHPFDQLKKHAINILCKDIFMTMPTQHPPTLDPVAVQRLQRLPAGPAPWLHEEVGQRMEERLAWIKLKPTKWAHWAPVRGGLQAHSLLAKRYPEAECFMVESERSKSQYALKSVAKSWWKPSRWAGSPARLESPAEGAVQLVWANMALHMAADPQALLAEWHRALATDGFVMFSCLGPDTLVELRRLYQYMGWPEPAHEFTDMHDWGDMLVGAGFAEPVMDMERITLTFESPERLLQELRGLGRNLHVQRFSGLRGRGWLKSLHKALDSAPLQLTFEVIYGHAFKPAPRLTMRPETVLSLAQMRETLNQRKTYPVEP
jgi:malonyl-CoA O-methyltransferase